LIFGSIFLKTFSKSSSVAGTGSQLRRIIAARRWNGEPRNKFLLIIRNAREKFMFVKSFTAAVAGTALLATIASAQTPTATTDRADAPSSATLSSSSLQGFWRASQVVGLKVYNDKNESLGSINDLLMDKGGNIKAAILGVGGFLGVGEHLVAVPLDKVKFVNEPVAYTGTAGSSGTTPTPSSTTTGSTAGSAASKPNPWYPDHAVFNATKDELKGMPEFKYSD
jgi:sporulation protein YlmC with PRC-barrel domain